MFVGRLLSIRPEARTMSSLARFSRPRRRGCRRSLEPVQSRSMDTPAPDAALRFPRGCSASRHTPINRENPRVMFMLILTVILAKNLGRRLFPATQPHDTGNTQLNLDDRIGDLLQPNMYMVRNLSYSYRDFIFAHNFSPWRFGIIACILFATLMSIRAHRIKMLTPRRKARHLARYSSSLCALASLRVFPFAGRRQPSQTRVAFIHELHSDRELF